MINKIFNWTIGSFFRSLGRVICYIFIALLLMFIFNRLDVFAAEYGYSSGTYAVGWSGCGMALNNCIWKQWSSQLPYGERQVKPDLDVFTYGSRISIRVYGGSDYIYKKGNTYHFRYTFSTTDDMFNAMSYWYLYAANGNTSSSTSGQFELDFESDVIGYKISRNNTGNNYFDVVISISPSQDYKYFNFYLSMPITVSNVGPNTGYDSVLTNYGIPQNIQLRSLEVNYSEGVGSQIDNQTTIIQNNFNETNNNINKVDESVKDLNDSIKDSNTSNSEKKANSFFDSFTNTDHGGISGIITAPLVAIREMLNGTCTPMSTEYKGKTISLPCGYEFWNRMPEIHNFYNLVAGGLLCYAMILKLFKMIENLKNPDDDRVEVMNL